MNRKISFFVIFLLIMISCGGETEQIVSETTTSTILDTTSTSSSTTTTIVEINEKNEQKCPEDDNSTIDFSKIKNIQLFLNKYGFDAGEPDGVADSQTVEAIKEFGGVITSSPLFTPNKCIAIVNASVPLFIEIAYFVPHLLEILFSNKSISLPPI